MQGSVDTLASPCGVYVDALDPPELSVSPIAPFVGDEQLSHDYCIERSSLPQVCDVKPAVLRLFEDRLSSLSQECLIERSLFSLLCHGGAECRECVQIIQGCRTDGEVIGEDHDALRVGAVSQPGKGRYNPAENSSFNASSGSRLSGRSCVLGIIAKYPVKG